MKFSCSALLLYAALVFQVASAKFIERNSREIDKDSCDFELGQTIHSCYRWSSSCCGGRETNCDRVKKYCSRDDFEGQLATAKACGLSDTDAATARREFDGLDFECKQRQEERNPAPRERRREQPAATERRAPAPSKRKPVAEPASNGGDPCLDVIYADKHYGDCCGHGNWEKFGHQPVCHELQKERREEGEAKNIDYHKEPPESKVLVIEGDLFYERVAKRHDVMLLMFYAPWCGYCKKFSPEFREAANDLFHYGVTFAKIDTTNPENANLKAQFGIKSYPVLKILFSGKVDERLSSGIQFIRSAADVANFMKYVKDRKEPPMPEGYEMSENGLVKPDKPAAASSKPAAGTDEPADSKVVVLDDASFQTHVASNPVTMVEFFAPWCGHCKKLAPKYTEAAAVLAKNDNIRIAKVDATAHKERAGELGVRGYPTVKVFLNGKFHEDYKGAREADAIVKHLRNLAKTASNLPTKEEDDPCTDSSFAADNYRACCAGGGSRLPGRMDACKAARTRGREL